MKIYSLDINQQKNISVKKLKKNNQAISHYENNKNENCNNPTFKGKQTGDVGCLTVLAVLFSLVAGIAGCMAGILGCLYCLCNLHKTSHEENHDKEKITCCHQQAYTNNQCSPTPSIIECQPKNTEAQKVNTDVLENNLTCADSVIATRQDSIKNTTNIQPTIKLSREENIAELENKLCAKNKELNLKMKEYKQLKERGTSRLVGSTVLGLLPGILVLPPGPHTPITALAALIAGLPLAGGVGGTYVYNNSKETKFYETQILPLEKDIKEIKAELSSLRNPSSR